MRESDSKFSIVLLGLLFAGLTIAGTAGCEHNGAPSTEDSGKDGAPSAESPTGPLSGSYPRSATDRKTLDYQAELPAAPAGDGRGYFYPPARTEVPEGPFGEAVKRGARIFRETDVYAKEFVGNGMQCAHCHLDNGRRPDSAPMWAAWTQYPAYRRKNDHVNSMEERLQGCFTYSMNAQASEAGKAPDLGHRVLTDLQSYMYWLATDAPTGRALPGRGYPKLDKPTNGWSVERGAEIYAESCAICHGANGEGMKVDGEYAFPPLWGADSYNWGAGMHRINTAAGFIKANMPFGQRNTLTDQQAWDVAAYINSHPRPADP